LYVARKLKKILPDVKLIPIVGAIKSKNFVTKAKNVGFVFPCHGLTIPVPVRNFLKKINVKSSNYFFAIVTRGGTVFRGFSMIDNCLKKQGKFLNAAFTIDMALNDPKLEYFTVPTKDELDVLEMNVLQKLKFIRKVILNKENYNGDDKNGVTFSSNPFLNYCPVEAVQIYSKIWMKSYTTEKGRYPHPYATVEDISKQKTA